MHTLAHECTRMRAVRPSVPIDHYSLHVVRAHEGLDVRGRHRVAGGRADHLELLDELLALALVLLGGDGVAYKRALQLLGGLDDGVQLLEGKGGRGGGGKEKK